MRRFYEQTLWIPQNFPPTNPDLHHGLVANDYFFSGHTAIAVLAATEMARMGRRWLTGFGVLIVVFEVLAILSVTLAPLMEELFFRGFLYPVLARRLGLPIAVFLTALGFALLHGAQLMFSWGPVLVIFLVGMIFTIVRARTNSVAAGVLIHMAYNGTIAVAMFAATDGFRHLEKLNQ